MNEWAEGMWVHWMGCGCLRKLRSTGDNQAPNNKNWQYFRKMSQSQMCPQKAGHSIGRLYLTSYILTHITDKAVTQAKKLSATSGRLRAFL